MNNNIKNSLPQFIYQKQINGKDFLFRFPEQGDTLQMVEYSNEFNAESEFTLFPEERINSTDAQVYLARIIGKIERHESIYLFVFCKNVDKLRLAGRININLEPGLQQHLGELGISIREEYRNIGLGTTLIELAIEVAKRWLSGLEIIQLTTFSTNQRALHLYQKLGFKEFGRLPKGVKRSDQYQDFVYMWREI